MPYDAEFLEAAGKGNIKHMEKYLALGANIKTKDTKGRTALLHAALNNHLAAIEWLIEKKQVDPLETDYTGNSALLIAAFMGCLPIAKFLVNKKRDILTMRNMNGDSALLYAAAKNHFLIIKWLLDEMFVNPEEANNSQRTAFLIAVYHGHIELAQWLAGKNINVNAKTHIGNTAFLIAASRGYLNILKWLKANYDINLEETNIDGETALIAAVKGNHLNTVQWLISEHADINHKDKSHTALDIAKSLGHNTIYNYLSKHIELQNQKELKKVKFQQELKEISTLSRLGRLQLRDSQHLFDQLEVKAKELANAPFTAEFYQTRGDFYDWLATHENDRNLKNEHYDNAIKDYKNALSIEPKLTILINRINEIMTIQNKPSTPAPPPSIKTDVISKKSPFNPLFFKPPTPPPAPAAPTSPKITRNSFARLGKASKQLRKP